MSLVTAIAESYRLETRPLLPSDGPLLAELALRLSPTTQMLRFFVAGTPVERWIVALLGADPRRHLVECLLYQDGFGTMMVGVAEVVRTAEEPGLGEFALAVADDWQRLGVGSVLTRRMAVRSLEAGIGRWKIGSGEGGI